MPDSTGISDAQGEVGSRSPTAQICPDIGAKVAIGSPQWLVYTRLGQYGYGENNWFSEKGFATFEEAEVFLDGPSYDFPNSAKRRENGWLGPVKALAVCRGGQPFAGPWLGDALKVSGSDKSETFERLFDKMWKASAAHAIPHVMEQMEREGLLPKATSSGKQSEFTRDQQEQIHHRADKYKLPEIECTLDESWEFFETEMNASRRLAHLNPDETTGYERRLFAAALDLEDALREQHTGLTAADIFNFWTSIQVWVHLADFCRQTLWCGRSNYQDIEGARLRFGTILGSYAHTIRPRKQAEQTARAELTMSEEEPIQLKQTGVESGTDLRHLASALPMRADSVPAGFEKAPQTELVTAAVVPTARARAPEVPNVTGDEIVCKPADTQLDHARIVKESRAMTVAKPIRELNDLKPQIFEDDSEYARLRGLYPDYLTFKIAETRPDLKQKILSIRSSTRHIRLAQELAAAHHGRELSTIKDDWKDHKPPEFKRRP